MAMWVFGYGSLIWKAGFPYDERLVGFIKDYRRVFYQGSTDHRGTPEFPGRTVTLEPVKGDVCWGAAYKIVNKKDQLTALESNIFTVECFVSESINYAFEDCNDKRLLQRPPKCLHLVLSQKNVFDYRNADCLQHLEVREKQYDKKAFVDFFTESSASEPVVSNVMVYIGSADKKQNVNYLGPAPLEEIALQIAQAEGPSGPNRDYLFKLENALIQIGCEDKHVIDLSNEVRRILLQEPIA